MPHPLSIAFRLFASLLLAVLGRAIPLTRPPALPMTSRVATLFTAVVRSWMPWPEQPFTALEQTTPGPIKTALWSFANVPNKMTLVHGSRLLPPVKSRSEAPTSLRGVSPARSLPPFVRGYFTRSANPAIHHWRRGPVHCAVLARFQSAADSSGYSGMSTASFSTPRLTGVYLMSAARSRSSLTM